jgi:hypothetical protein
LSSSFCLGRRRWCEQAHTFLSSTAWLLRKWCSLSTDRRGRSARAPGGRRGGAARQTPRAGHVVHASVWADLIVQALPTRVLFIDGITLADRLRRSHGRYNSTIVLHCGWYPV